MLAFIHGKSNSSPGPILPTHRLASCHGKNGRTGEEMEGQKQLLALFPMTPCKDGLRSEMFKSAFCNILTGMVCAEHPDQHEGEKVCVL